MKDPLIYGASLGGSLFVSLYHRLTMAMASDLEESTQTAFNFRIDASL